MNILHAGNKLLMQQGFFTVSVGDLLPSLEFLGRLYNFCNFCFLLVFDHFQICKICHYYHRSSWFIFIFSLILFGNNRILPKTCSWNSKSSKTKDYVRNYARYTKLKSFLLVYVGTYDCYENIKKNSDLQLILKPWHWRNL